MKFGVYKNEAGTVYIQIDNISTLFFIKSEGLNLNSTIYPQPGVDYTNYDKIKVIGMDIV